MIVKEYYRTRTDGIKLFRTYSDEGKMIIQNETGLEYTEAIDIENAPYTYSESENEIGAGENGELSAEEALDIIVGGDV